MHLFLVQSCIELRSRRHNKWYLTSTRVSLSAVMGDEVVVKDLCSKGAVDDWCTSVYRPERTPTALRVLPLYSAYSHCTLRTQDVLRVYSVNSTPALLNVLRLYSGRTLRTPSTVQLYSACSECTPRNPRLFHVLGVYCTHYGRTQAVLRVIRVIICMHTACIVNKRTT